MSELSRVINMLKVVRTGGRSVQHYSDRDIWSDRDIVRKQTGRRTGVVSADALGVPRTSGRETLINGGFKARDFVVH